MVEKIAFIGGSGIYSLFPGATEIVVDTPYGKVNSLTKIEQENKELFFLPRHHKDHSVPPHLVNYRANLFALHQLGVEKIISTNAVGTLDLNIPLGSFVIPDQFIDFTKCRPSTFYDGSTTISFSDHSVRKGVLHIDFTDPYCPNVRKKLFEAIQHIGEKPFSNGVYVCTEGPRFETPAEIKMYKGMGGTIVGMTSVPEVVLARELKICYASLSIVTNFAAGYQESVSHAEVLELFDKRIDTVKMALYQYITSDKEDYSCKCKLY